MTQPDDTPMVSVPREPTEAMLQAGLAVGDYPWDGRKPARIWQAMIAASPPLAEGVPSAWMWPDSGIEIVVRGNLPHPASAEPLFTRAALQGN